MTETPETNHPEWCVPPLCDAEVPALPALGGAHRGEPRRLVLALSDGDAMLVVAQLQQPAGEASPQLAVQVAGGRLVLVPVDQVQMMVDHLAPLLGLTLTAAA
ncbi:hypothetical protein [Micromonospora yangpuensis]|uniref:Uncharacterized protein n=1 Tax=Micromonospora yangpuensis TaxID=683228 RepID=A0A1C6VDQ8_9ACTN|nr:hypothetical protein [Micromonospora yangpuensis]GGM14001.1 hypothetical protein GCM10012279_35250 [Micromonospora yangpuensis]SCL64472.1 hypothetical protein GA0070617_5481 [Micromonospora yangpuensis]